MAPPHAKHSCEKKIVPPTAQELYEDHAIWDKEIEWDGQTLTSTFLNNIQTTLLAHVQVMHDALPFLTNNDPDVATGFKALAAFATKIFNHYDQATGDDLATYGKVEKKAGILFENLGSEHRKKLLMIEEKLKNGLEVVKGDFAKPTQMVIQSIKSPEDEATMGPINAKAADERALEIHYLEVARETSSLRAPGGREIGIDKILGHEKGGRMN